jgi:hypothetical protein
MDLLMEDDYEKMDCNAAGADSGSLYSLLSKAG